jgi:hypothetical protein
MCGQILANFQSKRMQKVGLLYWHNLAQKYEIFFLVFSHQRSPGACSFDEKNVPINQTKFLQSLRLNIC